MKKLESNFIKEDIKINLLTKRKLLIETLGEINQVEKKYKQSINGKRTEFYDDLNTNELI